MLYKIAGVIIYHMRKTPNMKYETPKDPAKAGPTGQGERERERVIRAPQFLNFSKFIYFLIFPITLGRFLFLAN